MTFDNILPHIFYTLLFYFKAYEVEKSQSFIMSIVHIIIRTAENREFAQAHVPSGQCTFQ